MRSRRDGRRADASRGLSRARRAFALAAVLLGAWAPGAPAIGLHADDVDAARVLPAPTGVEAAAPVATPRLVARGPRRVAVVMFNFASLPATPWTADEARTAVFTGPASLNTFEQEQSFGAVALAGKVRADGDVFGWYTIPDGTAVCDPGAWMASANAAASAAGVDLTGYQHRIYTFPGVAACGWTGAADMPGTDSFLSGTISVRVLAHELGHNLGAEHASAIRCVDAAGAPVSFSTSCTQSEYGDPYDVMGTSRRHPAAFRKAEAGFIPLSGLATVVQTGTYRLESSSALAGGIASLRVQRGTASEYWYMDLRSPTGVFEDVAATDPTVTGVTVRLAGDYRLATRTRLIDAAPATATFADAPLQAGQGFTDPTTGIAIVVASVALGAAMVTVTVPGTVTLASAPIVPDTALSAVANPIPAPIATASLRRISPRRGVIRVVVPLTAGPHRCSVRVSGGRLVRCRIAGRRATRVQSVLLRGRTVPVQVRLDGRVVMSVRLRVPRAGHVSRLTKALSLT